MVSGFSRPNPGTTRPHSHQLPSYTHSHLAQSDFHIGCMLNLTIMCQEGDALYFKLIFANQTYICQRGDALYYKLYDKLLGRRPATLLALRLDERLQRMKPLALLSSKLEGNYLFTGVVTGAARPPTFQLPPSLVHSFFWGESSE